MPTELVLPARNKAVYFEKRHLLLDAANPILEGVPKVYRAQSIKITGKHIAPSTDIWVIADVLEADADSLIDVSGRDGFPSYAPNDGAKNGAAPGQAGQNAEQSDRPPAAHGGNGGRVTVICRQLRGSLTVYSHGGQGGNGLNGGNGANGSPGAKGKASQTSAAAAKGGRGANGGRGGDGGAAGNGGDAGLIRVAAEDSRLAQISCLAHGGKAGKKGIGGKGGQGGEGGPGSEWGESDGDHPGGRW